jgi:hypothetical protein
LGDSDVVAIMNCFIKGETAATEPELNSLDITIANRQGMNARDVDVKWYLTMTVLDRSPVYDKNNNDTTGRRSRGRRRSQQPAATTTTTTTTTTASPFNF